MKCSWKRKLLPGQREMPGVAQDPGELPISTVAVKMFILTQD
jgi:hypothetical protein